jgi:hypothetical protein
VRLCGFADRAQQQLEAVFSLPGTRTDRGRAGIDDLMPSLPHSAMSSVRSASVKAPSAAPSAIEKPADVASVRSTRSKATTTTGSQVQPLSSANLSKLETRSNASVTGSKHTASRGGTSVSSRTTVQVGPEWLVLVVPDYPLQATPSAYSFNVNDFQVPYTKRQMPASERVVPTNTELKRANLMDRYAGMRGEHAPCRPREMRMLR